MAKLFHPAVEISFRGATTDLSGLLLRRFLYRESVYGLAEIKLLVHTDTWQIFDQIFQDGGKTPVRIRYGTVFEKGQTWSDWKTVYLLFADCQYMSRAFTILTLQGFDAGYVMSERVRGKAYLNKKVSDVVKEIADANGFKTDIEETSGAYNFYSCLHTDYTFIRDFLLKRAVSPKGKAGYVFYVKNGDTLVFKRPVFNRAWATFKYSIQEPGDEVLRWSLKYRRVFQASEMSLVNEVRGFRPFHKEALFKTLQDGVVGFDDAPGNPPSPATSTFPARAEIMVSPGMEDFFRDTSVLDNGEALWAENARGYYEGRIVTIPKPDAYVGSTLHLDIRDNQGAEHWSSGLWFVSAVNFQITADRNVSVFEVQRRNSRMPTDQLVVDQGAARPVVHMVNTRMNPGI